MGKSLTNIGVLMMCVGIFGAIGGSTPIGMLLIVGFFVAVIGRMATSTEAHTD